MPHSSNKILITDVEHGSGVLQISKSGTAIQIVKTTIPGKNTTCWVAYSPATGTVFIVDALKITFNEIDMATGAVLSSLHGEKSNLRNLDITAAGYRVYALSAKFSLD